MPRGLTGKDLAIELPMHGILVDQATYSWTNMQITLSRDKAPYWSLEPGRNLWIPTQQVLSTRTGIFWTEQSPADRLAALHLAEPLLPIGKEECLRYMGCDIRPKKGARVPSNLDEIPTDIDLSLKRVRLTPDQARMTVMAMVLTKWYAVSSAYRPTDTQRQKNAAQLIRVCKAITRLHSSACRDAIFVAERDFGLGLVYSQDYYAATVIREWLRNHYQDGPGFRKAKRDYLADVHSRLGGCPAVVLPNQRGEDAQPHVPHAGRSLQRIVDYVGPPLWLPGAYTGTTRIVLRQPRT